MNEAAAGCFASDGERRSRLDVWNLKNLILLFWRQNRLVHECGYEIRTDEQGHWYFRRPNGRAIPTQGYQSNDMTDDYLSNPVDGASAEAFSKWPIREPEMRYLS